MVLTFEGKEYITDNDLEIHVLGGLPKVDIQNYELRRIFEEVYERDFLGGDELISYAQSLVSHGMNFAKLEDEILNDIKTRDCDFKDTLFNKTATGIGRGHSLGGLSVVELGVHGTKMIDSGLTGLCMSRSLVTSSRRRETGTGDIAIPEGLESYPELLNEYMETSNEVFNLGKEFKEKFGKMNGVETFNKAIPYNNPADLLITLPLDSLATITAEVEADKINPNGRFVPKELYALSEMFNGITKKVGQNIMYNQRIQVPRDTYMHYTVFKNPCNPNYALEKGQEVSMDIHPRIVNLHTDFTPEFLAGLDNLRKLNEKVMKITDPKQLHNASLDYMHAQKRFTNEFNETISLTIADTLTWRVWSEQKRHATHRQQVESIYSAGPRAHNNMIPFWDIIDNAYSNNDFTAIEKVLPEIEKNIVIDERLKKQPEIIIPYVYHTMKQLMLYGKMIGKGIEHRDALYTLPKNVRVRTTETYDLTNLINLEFPLRLCNTCEPERKASSWEKRKHIVDAVPELDYFLKSKCSVGFCTEGKYCSQITDQREYDLDLHKQTKQAMLDKARANL